MPPQVVDKLWLYLLEPGLDQLCHIPKTTTSVRLLIMTYLLPVFTACGFRSVDLRKANAYSIGEPANEYGAETHTRKPSDYMCLMDSLHV